RRAFDLLAHPFDKGIRRGHSGESALTDESPIVEKTALFDSAKGDGWIDAPEVAEFGDGQFRVFGIRAGIADDICQANHRRFAHAVVNEGPIAFFHGPNRPQRGRVTNSVPNGLDITL